MHLTVVDYVVTVTMLLIPLGIGVFYAWRDAKSSNRDDYLLGGRQMSVIPVTLSIFVTFQSAIGLIGFPSDIYRYGPMAALFYVGNSVGCIITYFTMIPVMHPLQLTSIFDYLEMRYHSHAIRILSTVVGMLQTYLYMVMAMLAPGLALQAAAGIPFWMSVAVVGSIGTLYTAIGGIKSVIWTDAFQTFIIFFGLFMLIIRGTWVVGGVHEVWRVAEQGGRTSVNYFSPDPRARHSWWGMMIGTPVIWLTSVFGQSNLQRVSAMKSVKDAQRSALFNIPCLLMYGVLLAAVGIIVYSYFYVLRCDPLEGGLISNLNQITLYFMIHVLQDYPGLAGFYMATIFSGALSTLSSGINALAANTVEDIMGVHLQGVSERKIIVWAKVMVFVYGFSIIGVTYLAESLQGPVTQLTSSIIGALGSVVLGLFLVGFSVPWANKYGAFASFFLTLALNLWIVLGHLFHGRKSPPLPSPPTDNCSIANNRGDLSNLTSWPSISTTSWLNTTATTTISDTNDPYEYGFFLYDISYEWYAFIGATIGSAAILIVSKITQRLSDTKVNARLILPSLRRFWKLEVTPKIDDHELDAMI